ncbi:Protein kinase,putative [Trichomonas vaginalis G3]|uniref:Protein kinase,putative n=1 Tax=Trichomonas vaginalis (strain ATCC PRA-98 / G3) TaxID=412133 RepID=A2EBR9_TRIV3|nr:protein serine/threonine kinase protein [Trichomonas vaginalis G3]EAY09881.1 Protein kinase,putative [Trichomonas vaginalis G3]KAI5514683.1 protein serine/threonine kinase protein [Trichomonas vaginalis G3]|eukprot:XP_001322104.1 Protein kinase [Trichomonas vaginalis G3]
MIDKYGRLKISDFGLSSIYKDHPTSNLFKGTRLFMAPEIFFFKEYDPMAADVWAICVTLFYIATRTYPFYSNDPRVLFQKIEKGVYNDKLIDDPLLKLVISRCIETDPKYRAKVGELLEMPYFAPYNQPQPERLPLFIRDPNMKSQQLIVKPNLTGRRASIGAISLLKMKGLMGSRLQLTTIPNKSLETFNV